MIQPGASLADVEAMIRGMAPEARDRLNTLIEPVARLPWIAQPGPQVDAYHHQADELLYGGAAGGGKSDLLCGLAITAHHRSLLFRRQATDLEGLWERIVELVEPRGLVADINSVKKRLRLKDGKLIEMGHLEKPGSEKSWQGRAHDLIGFDEAAQLDEAKVMFVMQWLRSTLPNQNVRAVFATNPPVPEMRGGELMDVGSGDYLIRWFAPWIDPHFPDPAQHGELRWCYMTREGDRFVTHWVDGPGWYNTETGERWEDEDPTPKVITKNHLARARSRTFIKSLVRDNAFLAGTGYVERLSSTPEPLRSMLMDGRFGIKLEDHEWQVIPTQWVLMAQERWQDRMDRIQRGEEGFRTWPMCVLAADIAQGGADTTVLAALREDNFFDELVTQPGRKTPDGPSVAGLILSKQRDSAMIVLDGSGGWGGSTRDMLKTHHKIDTTLCISSEGTSEWSLDMRYTFLNYRALMWWRLREALDPMGDHQLMLPPSDTLRAQLTAVHYAIVRNQVQIEGKDALRKRLGSSTDEADAVAMAWLYKPIAIARRHRADPIKVSHGGWNPGMENERHDRVPDIDPLEDWAPD